MLSQVERQWTLLEQQRHQLVKDLAEANAKAKVLRAEKTRRNGG